MSHPLTYGANFEIVGKTDPQLLSYAGAFQPIKGTFSDLAAHISKGHPWMPAILDRGARRYQQHANHAEVLAVDVDGGMTIEEARQHPFVAAYCSLAIESSSSSPEHHKFRLVFRLPEALTDWQTIRACNCYLIELLGVADPSCKDASRFFFGGLERSAFLLNEAATLPADFIQQVQERTEQEQRDRAERERLAAIKRELFRKKAQSEDWDTDTLIQQALSFIPPRAIGGNNYSECIQVLMALNSHYGAIEAERIGESWSPSIAGSTWDVGRKVSSFKQSQGITIGTLFHLAGQHGFRFPTPKNQQRWDEPDPGAYDAYRIWEDEQRRLDSIQAEQGAFDRITEWAKSIATRALGFGQPQPKRAAKEQERVHYVPGQIPHISDCRGWKSLPTFVYQRDELPQLLAEAKAKGWKDILDTSATGSGKSHKYASLPTRLLLDAPQQRDEGQEGSSAMNRVWLLSQNHRNPSTLPAEQHFVDMPVRNAGLVEDNSRQTPMGENFVRWAKPGETPNIAGNCHLTPLFHKAQSKGISAATATADLNPICEMCSQKEDCGKPESIGRNGYGFRAERGEIFKERIRVRSNLNSLPDPVNYLAYEGDAAIVEEAMTHLQPTETIGVSLQDFDSAWAELEAQMPEAYDQLNELRKTLRPLVAGDERQHYGYDDAAIRKRLPTSPEHFLEMLEEIRSVMTVNLNDFANAPDSAATAEETKAIVSLKGKITRRQKNLESLQTDLERAQRNKASKEIAQLTTSIAQLTADIQDLQQQLKKLESDRQTVGDFNRRQRREAKQGLDQALDNLPMQWLIPFLEVWSGVAPGALRINSWGGLSVTVMNSQQNETLNAMGFRIYLDATATPNRLSLYRQISVSSIFQIEMNVPKPTNLDVIHVRGLGLAGKGRSELCDERITALLAELKQRHPDLVTFDWLKKVETSVADGHWFSDFTRGTNEFADRSAIAAIGLPMPNYGAFYDLWLTMTQQSDVSNHLSFDDFYQELIDAEIIQAVGRLRANRRPDEKLTFYLIGDSDRYQLPAELNAREVQARDITIDAATPAERAWKAAIEFTQRWWTKTGDLPSQEQVATAGGITQGYLSKLAAQFKGGWKQVKKIFQSLLETPYRDWNIFEPTPDELWTAQEYLPATAKSASSDVAIDLNSVIETYGWGGWRRILSKTSAATRYQLAWALLKDGFAPVATPSEATA